MKPKQGKSAINIRSNAPFNLDVAGNTNEPIVHPSTQKKPCFSDKKSQESSFSPYRSTNLLAKKIETFRPARPKLNPSALKKPLIDSVSPSKTYPKAISLEKLTLSNKLLSINQLFKPSKLELKNLNFSEELCTNYKIFSENLEFKQKTWFENIISLQERKNNKKSLIEDLKFCNDMFRDLIIRMKTCGKENEGILIDKIWRFLLEIIDDYIQQIQENIFKSELASKNSLKAQEEIEKIKKFCQKKVNKLEKGIERVKLDYVLAKDPRKLLENQKIKAIGPRIEKIKAFIENIWERQDLEYKNIETRRKSLSETQDFNEENTITGKRKKSLELSIIHSDISVNLKKKSKHKD